MPIDQQTADALTGILQRLRTGCDEIANLLPNAAPQLGEARLAALQRNYAEVSNYDRHYSTTRSALTTLLVTIGLLIVVDPLKELTNLSTCDVISVGAGFSNLFSRYSITFLLFFVAFPLNLYFRRMTTACGWLERAIEREMGRSSVLPNTTNITLPTYLVNLQLADPPLGYYFRYDLYRVAKQIRWPRADPITMLLLFSVLSFASILFILKFANCAFWRAWRTYCALLLPVFATFLIYIHNQIRPAPEQLID